MIGGGEEDEGGGLETSQADVESGVRRTGKRQGDVLGGI